MERVRFIEHCGAQVLLIDCSQCGPRELSAIFQEVQQLVTSQPPGSTLTLADFTEAEFDKSTADQLKIVATYDRPYVKRAAFVGAETLPDVYYHNLISFSARQFPLFKTREEALDWLVGDLAQRAVS